MAIDMYTPMKCRRSFDRVIHYQKFYFALSCAYILAVKLSLITQIYYTRLIRSMVIPVDIEGGKLAEAINGVAFATVGRIPTIVLAR